MPSLSQTIIINVGANYIQTYLKQRGIQRTAEKAGQDLKYWVDELLKEDKISIPEFEEFLFEELFWGKRKSIRVYKLENPRRYKYPSDWEKALDENYDIHTMDFCDILGNVANNKETRKIAAVRYEENSRGELNKIRILFSVYIDLNTANGYMGSTAYIPVEVDFTRNRMIIKAWKRQQVTPDNNVDNLITHIKKLMEIEFGVMLKNYGIEHKKVLFLMSKKLIYEVYSHVPTYNQIGNLKNEISGFAQRIIGELPLRHVMVDETGKVTLEEGVMDLESEITNVLENMAISDHFHEKDFEEMWKMGLEAIVARIKFNDKESVLTSLSGEDTTVPIICTKTFMTLKKRMEETEKIENLWITMDRERGNLNLRFDATNPEYLEILIRYGIRFNEKDMNTAIEMYEKYERKLTEQTTEHYQIAIGQ